MNPPLIAFLVLFAADPTHDPQDRKSGSSSHRSSAMKAQSFRESGRRFPERPSDPWMPRQPSTIAGGIEHCGPWLRGPFASVQVNVDQAGCNITGDAANEPSIAVSAADPAKVVIGFRQFDTIVSNFRQAGYAYSHDGGGSWTFPGTLITGEFRSDPVLAADALGNIYYLSLVSDADLSFFYCELWRTSDAGLHWDTPVYAFGGDKAWMAIDNTGGAGDGNIYSAWDSYGCCGHGRFTRSFDGGSNFEDPIALPGQPEFGTIAVGPDGEVYVAGVTAVIVRSDNANDPAQSPFFENFGGADLGGEWSGWRGPNPGGLLGQTWVAIDHSAGSFRGFAYLLATVEPYTGNDPSEVMFSRSTSRGRYWTPPRRVHDDPPGNGASQWFGTMSVAPNGRIDVLWNDTRNGPDVRHSELHYSASVDAGRTWSPNVAVSPMFDSWLGWPNQSKIGDYYHAVSDRDGVSVAYAATFNGEQDVYFLRIPADCDADGIPDAAALTQGSATDANFNAIPDECEPDTDGDLVLDVDDSDMDDDGVDNSADRCPFGPPGFRARSNGVPYGDYWQDCTIDMTDHKEWISFQSCFSGPGVERRCREGLDFDADGDADLVDVSYYQRIFGQYGG